MAILVIPWYHDGALNWHKVPCYNLPKHCDGTASPALPALRPVSRWNGDESGRFGVGHLSPRV